MFTKNVTIGSYMSFRSHEMLAMKKYNRQFSTLLEQNWSKLTTEII